MILKPLWYHTTATLNGESVTLTESDATYTGPLPPNFVKGNSDPISER